MADRDILADCPRNPDCVQYNIRVWTFAVIAAYILIFLRKQIRWGLPLGFWFPYVLFRVCEVSERLRGFQVYVGGLIYSLAMFWGYLCCSGWPVKRVLAIGTACAGVVYVTAYFALPRDTAECVFGSMFVVPYLFSLYALLREREYVWLAGLALGWLGPLVLFCAEGPERLYGTLSFVDLFGSFPLALAGQLSRALRDPPGHCRLESPRSPDEEE